MDTQDFTDLIDYLGDELPPERRVDLEQRLSREPALRRELDLLRDLRNDLCAADSPTPSAEADRRFAELLEAEMEAAAPGGPVKTLHPRPAAIMKTPSPRLRARPIFRLAAVAAVLLLVFATGWYFGGSSDRALDRELAATRSLMLELMADERGTTRMRAATVTLDVAVADPEVIANLGVMLREDPNANVRLAALDALARFADDPLARHEMLDAMATDPPPAVRVQLMETLVRLGDRRVLPYLEDIIEDENIPDPLRDRARLGSFKLI